MSILEGKKPVNLVKWQPYTIFHTPGWVFEEGLGNRFKLSSYQLGKILAARDKNGNRLAYIIVDEQLWDETIQHARGKKSGEEKRLASLKESAHLKALQCQRVAEELKSKEAQAKKVAAKDKNAAAKLFIEIEKLRHRRGLLEQDLLKIQRDLDAAKKAS